MMNVEQLHPHYITDAEGHKTSVVIPIEQFQELMEDIQDLAAAAERRDESSTSHDALIAELKNDGLL
ncbi:hypothetical protein ACMZOO_08735 [Catenovulum sp. SX2]|uniref:hypothetical protein n=1 Tax=Catenovulum sp. SX2 TaxID=3398614 RepID=UPI003F842AB8